MDRPTKFPDFLPAQGTGALLERLLEIADDAVIVADDQHRVVLFNRGAERVFGHAAGDVIGRPLDGLLPESARPAHAAHMQAFAASPLASRRMGQRRDIHGRRRDGTLFDAEASISHVELEGRIYFTAILRDVSETRTAQRELRAGEARFRTLAAAAPVGIFHADAAGRLIYVNPRWCEIAGMDAEEALGQGWKRALHPADRAAMLLAWQRSLDGAQPFSMRHRFLRPDGSEAWVGAAAVASRDDAGTVSGHIGTVTDITESHLQALALERAKSEAEAAARAKSLFLANMSHEIRTPLNAVIGMTTLLLDTPMSEDQREFARTVRSSSETLLGIINDILDFSKADVGKLEIEARPFDLRRCVEESLDLVLPRAFEKGLNVAYLIDDGTPEALVGDAVRIRQILVNLLSNAVKFTHQGEVFVAVDGEPVDAETHRIRLAVKDTGIGIAAEHLPRLFQSFTQVDPSTTRKYGGTGLGLAISKRLAELMGGGVAVQSEPGHGTVFTVDLLVRCAPAAEPAEFLQRDPPGLAGKRILIVDDNLTNRRILTKFALLWGMLPNTLPSAVEALDRIRHGEPFDIALLDASLPDIDGIDLAIEIHRRRPPEELPIVLLTSFGQAVMAQATGDVEVAACLTKPIKASVLYRTLVAIAGGERASGVTLAPLTPVPRAAALPLRVLVAEDNAVNQRVALRLLRHLGYAADFAHDGREAVAATTRQHYDVVLMDIQMPLTDGVAAAREIVARRRSDGRPRIIAMTANAMPGDREAYIAAGMDGYLAKPIELESLAAVIRQVALMPGGGGPPAGVVDVARLEELRRMQDDSQPRLVRELIDLFERDSPQHVQRILQAHARGEADALRGHAHRFLSAAQNVGAVQLSSLCIDIERYAKAGQLDAADPLLAALATARDHAAAALAALRIRY